MDLLGIALIIITVVGSVHVVYERGKQAGMSEGRQQILVENLQKAELQKTNFDDELKVVMTKIGSYA
jgi:hypothetical protein